MMEQAGPRSKQQEFKLPRGFALVAGLVLLGAGLLICLMQRQWDYEQLEEMAAINNTNVARLLANQLWSTHADILQDLAAADRATLPGRPDIATIDAEIKAAIQGAPVFRIKIYDLHGDVIYSTEPTQIGTNEGDDEGFVGARQGIVATELANRDSRSVFEDTVVDRDLLSSYVPIYRDGPGTEVVGVFEVYDDVTDVLAGIRRSLLWQATAILAIAGSVFLVLNWYVRLGDRMLRTEHGRSLSLVQAVARVEAASKAKSEFLAKMSHELRTPLNSVIGFAEILASESFGPLGNSRYKGFAGDIVNGARGLLGIIEKVMDLTRLELGTAHADRSPVDLGETLTDAARKIEACPTNRKIAIHVAVAPGLPVIEGDERKLRQVIEEILGNAVKFSPEGGTVVLRAERHTEPGCRVVVTDNGPGMTPQELDLAMMPFAQLDGSSTRKHAGAGLGLPLASGLIRLMGGRLDVATAPGTGTTVSIILPQTSAALAR